LDVQVQSKNGQLPGTAEVFQPHAP
jgi:hypothetical protein